jgi:choline dehydrogenase-like flavoprotein
MSASYDEVDVLIIGSGMGAAFAAHALARTSKSVLVIERGQRVQRDWDDWNPRRILVDGRYKRPELLAVKQYGRDVPQLDRAVVGGQSVFYGGACFRLREKDFDRWPLSYSDYERHYDEAEKILGVCGDDRNDPTAPRRRAPYSKKPTTLSRPARIMRQAAQSLGLSPCDIPLAIRFTAETSAATQCVLCNTCDGFPCKVSAKNEASTVLDAVLSDRVKLRSGVEALRLVQNAHAIAAVECVDVVTQELLTIRAKTVVLAAGAMHSPALLLKSDLSHCEGQAVVGRFLMRHANAVVGQVVPRRVNPEKVFQKQSVLFDFYEHHRSSHGTSTGVVQDIYTADPLVVAHYMPGFLKLGALLLTPYIQSLLVIAEDDPQAANRIEYSGGALRVVHDYCDRDLERRDFLVSKANLVLRASGGLYSKTMPITSFSHALGTLRMGPDPKSAVTDLQGRVYGYDNLFVADASFMPTSAGVNPSLTIAANALRVAANIA